MRKLLLASVALAGAAAYMPTAAFAQAPTVFPLTTTAGKLDGAAPGSVQVSLGGRLFSAVEFQGGTGNGGPNKRSDVNLVNYLRLYPTFDYASPSGVHFGAAFEIRTEGAQQGTGSGHNTLFGFSAQGYVSSPVFGKFEVGTPNSATDQLGVGTGDDFGTGGFYGEYGWINAPMFAMSDSYDGDVPKQKLAYISPAFAGFNVAISYQPTSVGLNNSGALLNNLPLDSAATGAQSRDRFEVAGAFSHAFGPASVKASVGYAHATPSVPGGDTGAYQDVNMVTAGAVVNFAGFEIEGSAVTGKWALNGNDSGSPFGPSLKGAHSTTSYTGGIGYSTGPYSLGVVYYGVSFDQGDGNGQGGDGDPAAVGKSGHIGGVALGGSYIVGPGVSVNFDAAYDEIKTSALAQQRTHSTLLGIGTYINW